MTPATLHAPTNVSEHLRSRAAEHPERIAVRGPTGDEITFGALESRVDALAHGLLRHGLAPGDRACLFVHPGPDLIALTHAMFRAGVVPVLIDPGMGRRSLLSCVERTAPRALIGVPRAHVARLLFPRSFRSVERAITVAPRWIARFPGSAPLPRLERAGRGEGRFDLPERDVDGEAAILFTSGSTGPAKGVVYTQKNFLAQLDALRRLYDLTPGEVDVACFPLFALFDNALGMTSVFPDLDPSRPGECRPERVFRAIEASGATFTFGSPAIWKRPLPPPPWCGHRRGPRSAVRARRCVSRPGGPWSARSARGFAWISATTASRTAGSSAVRRSRFSRSRRVLPPAARSKRNLRALREAGRRQRVERGVELAPGRVGSSRARRSRWRRRARRRRRSPRRRRGGSVPVSSSARTPRMIRSTVVAQSSSSAPEGRC